MSHTVGDVGAHHCTSATKVSASNVLGVPVGHWTYTTAIERIVDLGRRRIGSAVAACNVHMVMTARGNADFRRRLTEFELVIPDSQPVRWAVNLLGHAGLRQTVAGMDLTLRLCEVARDQDLGVFLYGSYPERVSRLGQNLRHWYPGLRLVGIQPSRFRPLTIEEDREDINRINDSGAHIVLVGMGCPRQEYWASEHRSSVKAVMVCVGGAFDVHSGVMPRAPEWIRQNGLEWAYRLLREPRRMWRRYIYNNPAFLVLLGAAWIRERLG
ncbi:MAG: WecB/TagA/CpsF family glycosyltransferase [Nitrosospira sp.]|nr:WecB/TagA/CpsF family glycosyltransferase [Nitrosospira sp.]MDN5881152.1 WecB/TagA/CpsF family glycosyltransferase [Nitrosospira sp.]MDN5934909.1 WecB/TagA/CpsF family glycosyltransferase [Nitrosospira sp.]